MPTLRRVYYSRPIPPDATPAEYKGKPAVRIDGPEGKPIIAPLTADGTRCRIPSAKWYGRFKDTDGMVRDVPLSGNRAAASQMLNELVKRVEMRKAGIVDSYTENRAVPLAKLLDEYKRNFLDKGGTVKEARQAVRRCEALFTGCGFVHLRDLDASAAARWLADRRTTPKAKGGFGPSTSNHYAKTGKAFGNWLTKAHRAPENPFRHLTKVNATVDVRKERRALSVDEFSRLLATARSGRTIRHMSGPDRERLYLTAAYTGLRASELASLTPASFALDVTPATLTVAAACSKHRREDTIPLHPDLVTVLGPGSPRCPIGPALARQVGEEQCGLEAH